jgi:hypothetical protein
MYRRVASILSLLLAALLAWQVWAARGQSSADFEAELAQADRKIRTMVMTQDLGYLRRQSLDLHKAYWDLRKDAQREARRRNWLLGCCSLALLGLGVYPWLRRPSAPK